MNMSVASRAFSATCRLVVFLAVFSWAPLAYTTKREPMAPLPTIARSVVHGAVKNQSLAAPLFSGLLMPGVLIRTPVSHWNTENSTRARELFRNLSANALVMGASKTNWYNTVVQPETLVGASHALYCGCLFLTFSRLSIGTTVASAIMLIALLIFMTVACHVNEAKPTPQAFAVLICLGLEFQKAFREVRAGVAETATKLAARDATAATAAEKGKAIAKGKKSSKKTD